MAYTPPSGDNILIDLAGAYVPPDGDNIDIDLGDSNLVTISLVPFIEIEQLSLTPVVGQQIVSLAPFIEIDQFSLRPSLRLHLAPFVEIEQLSLDVSYQQTVVHLAPFVEIGQFSLRPSLRLHLAPFVEIEQLSLDWKISLRKLWALVGGIGTGRKFLVSQNLEIQKRIVMRNSLIAAVNRSWAMKNTLSDASIHAAWAITNELTETDTVSRSWAMKNTIGDYTPSGGPGDFWGQGPVVHRPGSRGGYE
ncbi:hypothetical protein DRH14_03385 [Candidatus Shapirobacteria bacterium]|nr:MAG: hypothetical protein DRH14_03385 [Candidatus Shapirobacteria bacterium]